MASKPKVARDSPEMLPRWHQDEFDMESRIETAKGMRAPKAIPHKPILNEIGPWSVSVLYYTPV
jgi:hypothetical protein